MIEQLLEFNQQFVDEKQYENYVSDKYPSKKVAILTCMDTRLTNLLPAALGLKNGDVKMIKNAGAIITSPFGSVMRSLIVAIYDLNVNEILVIGHYDCGMQSLDSKAIMEKMKNRNITQEKISLIESCGVDFEKWLHGFDRVDDSVQSTVDLIKKHPLIPADVNVFGLIIDPTTGKVNRV